MHEGYYDGEPTIASLNITPNPVLDERTIQAMTEGFTLGKPFQTQFCNRSSRPSCFEKKSSIF